MAVNRPTDVKTKEKDVNAKLQLYGIYEAFSNGKVPSNKQIDVALNSFIESPALSQPSKKLSEEGRALLADVKDVVEKAKILLLTKNEGNVLQDFIWQCQKLDVSNAGSPKAPVDKETAKQHGNEALDGLKTLGTLIISNGQFRKLLSDAQVLLRDIAGDAAQKTANKVNPSDDALARIDEPAPDNTWHDVPDLSKGNVKSSLKQQFDKNKPFGKGELQKTGDQALNAASNQADARNGVVNEQGNVDQSASRDAAGTGADTAKDQLKSHYDQNVPDETKEKVDKSKEKLNQTKARTANYLKSKMPEERREQTIWRFKKMIVEIQGHSDYQQAIETLLSLAEEYGGHGKTVAQQGTGTVKGAHDDNSLQIAEADLKTLIERFANSTSTDDLWESINNIYKDADRDPELKNWFKSLDKYVRKCLQEQGFIMRDEANEEWNALYDKGNYLLRDRYREHTNRVLDEIKFLGDQFDQDPQNKAFAQSVQKLFQNLGNDENGKPIFKKHLLKDVTEVILPAAFENIRYVPIPRIEVSDPMIDAVVENLVIESDNLMPNALEFGSDNYFRWGRKKISNKHHNTIMISASGIQMDLKDVAYYVKKKQGFPSITDKGIMDIFLGGDGFSFKLQASTAHKKDTQNFAKIDKVDVNIKNLNIKVKKSNHKLLFGIAKPILLKVMRPVIQKVLEKQIRDSFTQADQFAWQINNSANKAIEAAKSDPENAPSIFQQYAEAVKNELTAKKAKAEQVASNTKVNMAVTKQDAIFKDINLPGGISTKATEYKELAAKGEKWESPVFSIGSAKESTNFPKLTPVTRKPHNAAPGQVRGGTGTTSESQFGATNSSPGYYGQATGGV
ncbi:hypothetical protein UCRPC4_g02745 [Phaeomoniella chlamydospora]|uniref:Bactericidal permeability-increasing protein n=1 Tax=Phaeomoniella chlamydospora TaxID=158046 RepID=A0A0G2EMF1_PHACM|nr:hypothetical protein UCRPC4_g02745 [Phaeomoniella chlamydospora]